MNKKQKDEAAWLLKGMNKDSSYDYSYVQGEIFYKGRRPALTNQQICLIIAAKLNKNSDWRKRAGILLNSQSEKKEFILVPDNSNAWYVIPSDRLGDWMSFLNSDEIEQGSIPSYADRVGEYPCKVTFQNYRIKHICCACCC